MSSCIRNTEKQEGGSQPMGFWAHGISQVQKTLFASLPQLQMPQRAEDKGTAPAPCAQAGRARTHLLIYPLHIKLHITLEMGQDHKALMNLHLLITFFLPREMTLKIIKKKFNFP